MRPICKAVLLGSALLLGFAHGASANVMFNLSNVTFAGGGTLTGSFTTNDALSSVVSYDITASKAGMFSGFEYTTSDSYVAASTLPQQYFQIGSNFLVDQLRLYFTSSLTSAGATISSVSSFEFEPLGGNRLLSGSIVPAAAAAAVPEPSSGVALGSGLAALVVAGLATRVSRRRNRTGDAAA